MDAIMGILKTILGLLSGLLEKFGIDISGFLPADE